MQALKLTYLIRNAEVRDHFLKEELPKGVSCDVVGTYVMDDGRELYILSFSTNGRTIAGARRLSRLRYKLRKEAARLLVDDASLKFAIMLYPRLAEYERKLRCVITLAICTGQGNSDERLVNDLEQLSLEQLGERIFCDRSFQNEMKDVIKGNSFTKDKIAKRLERLNEDTVWDRLFEPEALASVRLNYDTLRGVRNQVMHHHLITESYYDKAREMLNDVINELDTYIEKVRSDVNYSKQQIMRAADAIKLFRENYESELQNYADSLKRIADSVSAVQGISFDFNQLVDLTATNKIVDLIAQLRKDSDGYRTLVAINEAATNNIKAVQSMVSESTYKDIGRRLKEVLPGEYLAGLSTPNTLAMPSMDVSPFASLNADKSELALPKRLNVTDERNVGNGSIENNAKDSEKTKPDM